MGLTSIFVSHNLAVIRQVSDRVAVMRLGEVVEYGDVEQSLRATRSMTTRKRLIAAVPDPAIATSDHRRSPQHDRTQHLLHRRALRPHRHAGRRRLDRGAGRRRHLPASSRQGVGAIATQSWVNPYLGIDGLKLLEDGLSAQQALDKLIADDPGRDDPPARRSSTPGATPPPTPARTASTGPATSSAKASPFRATC